MSRTAPNWEELNAYVDGELAPPDAARVARAVAADSELARQVAAIASLKVAVSEGPGEVPEFHTSPPRRIAPRAVAACVAVFLAIAGALAFYLAPADTAPSWALQASAVHSAWAQRVTGETLRTVPANVYLAASRRMAGKAFIPDLSAAKLAVAYAEYRDPVGDMPRLLHVGYRGTRGCRLSLIVFDDIGADTVDQTQYRVDGTKIYGWRVAGLRFGVAATGMDERRLAVIVKAAREATMIQAVPSVPTRTALRESRRASEPCAG